MLYIPINIIHIVMRLFQLLVMAVPGLLNIRIHQLKVDIMKDNGVVRVMVHGNFHQQLIFLMEIIEVILMFQPILMVF